MRDVIISREETMFAEYKPSSFHLQWHITERCNLTCRHCYFDPKFLKNELSLSQLFKTLNDYVKLVRKWKLLRESSRISITGGEPMVRADFFKFLEKCFQNRKKTRYGILINGTLLNKEKTAKLKKLKIDYAQVSLEGTEEKNDGIRGRGTFRKIIEAIKLLVENKIPTSISVTITRQNLGDVPQIIQLARDLGVNGLGLRRFIPLGRGKQMKKLMLSPRETKELYLYTLRAQKKLKEQKAKLRLEIGCEDGILAQESYPANTCVAGYSSLTILPNGDVYPCRRLPIYVGNVLKQSLEEIFYNSRELKKLRNPENINIRCQDCPYFDKCRGGAKCVSYSYWKDTYLEEPQFLPDPQCWRLFK